MFKRSNVAFLVAALFVVAAGFWADNARVNAACNNKCYMRKDNFGCNLGPCIHHWVTDCLLCTNLQATLCVDNGDGGGTCSRTEDSVVYATHDSCDLLCSCAGNTVDVEAGNMGNQVEVYSYFRYVCVGNP
jgi:hypothetical protein